MNDDFQAKIKLLVKSEKAMLNLEMRRKSRQTFWIAMALLAILVALVMLNVTVYLLLAERYSNLQAAAILSGINLLVAGIFFFIASRQNMSAESKSIEDIREFAWSQVSSDLDDVKESVNEFKQSVVKVRRSVDSFTGSSMFGGINKVMPIISTLIDLNKKK
jgi:choline-glycine betaine transporter